MRPGHPRVAAILAALLPFPATGQWTADAEAKLLASDTAAGDHFGESVSIAGDTAVVGAYLDTHAGGSEAGAAYVFVRSGTAWSQQQKLVASDAGSDDHFGLTVSLAGDTLVVGAPNDQTPAGAAAGSAYVFVRSGTTWTQQQKLTASDAGAGDVFGYAVALSGETAVIGAPNDDDAGTNAGAAYVFVRSGSAWSEQHKLTAGDAAAGDLFGVAVALSGDTAVLGARLDDHSALANAGSAYVVTRSGTTWTEQQQLTAGDAGAGDWFGIAVGVSGDTAVVGAFQDDDGGLDSGSAYVFERSGTSWSEADKLVASDAAAGDWFGVSIALAGGAAVVGASKDDHGGFTDAGSAYAFLPDVAGWSEAAKLVASDAADLDQFGFSVAVASDTAVVGANVEDHAGLLSAGAAYVHRIAPGSPVSYCTAGTSASGCQALLSASGTASASAPSGFVLVAAGVEGAKDGLFFFGTNGQQANPWGNGTSLQCVVPPVSRAGLLAGTGTVGLCDGSLAQDLNALWCPGCPKAALNPGFGATVQVQLWYRDPLSTSNQTTSLSDALEFAVGL